MTAKQQSLIRGAAFYAADGGTEWRDRLEEWLRLQDAETLDLENVREYVITDSVRWLGKEGPFWAFQYDVH